MYPSVLFAGIHSTIALHWDLPISHKLARSKLSISQQILIVFLFLQKRNIPFMNKRKRNKWVKFSLRSHRFPSHFMSQEHDPSSKHDPCTQPSQTPTQFPPISIFQFIIFNNYAFYVLRFEIDFDWLNKWEYFTEWIEALIGSFCDLLIWNEKKRAISLKWK
jgi:hypothetical protein